MKIIWHGEPLVSLEDRERNVAYCASLGLPEVGESERPPLAVVGGGPSVARRIEELWDWQGDMWVCGTAYLWAMEKDLKATYFNVDQAEDQGIFSKGAKHAILATCCSPGQFDSLKGAKIEVFDVTAYSHGPSCASCTFELALRMGYRSVTYFGCESSYADGACHAYAYPWFQQKAQLRVVCGGKTFDTEAALLMQAEHMAALIREFPAFFMEKSGGLLRQMIQTPDYDITHGSLDLYDRIFNKKAA